MGRSGHPGQLRRMRRSTYWGFGNTLTVIRRLSPRRAWRCPLHLEAGCRGRALCLRVCLTCHESYQPAPLALTLEHEHVTARRGCSLRILHVTFPSALGRNGVISAEAILALRCSGHPTCCSSPTMVVLRYETRTDFILEAAF
jgi:hypothetical protein